MQVTLRLTICERDMLMEHIREHADGDKSMWELYDHVDVDDYGTGYIRVLLSKEQHYMLTSLLREVSI